jgi:hypothetical protein
MNLGKIIASVVTVGVLLLIQDATQAQQKPIVQRPFHIEGRGAAATFEELWSRSDVVIEGIVEKEQPADYVVRGTALVHTMYDVRLVEIYKLSKHLTKQTDSIQVRRRGGVRDVGSQVEVHAADTFPLFKQGERYLMFLRETEWAQSSPYQGIFYYGTTYDGPDSFLKAEPSGFRSSAQTSLARSMGAMSLEALRDQLRRSAGAGK